MSKTFVCAIVFVAFFFATTPAFSQNNNLAAGDIAFVSYQSDIDLTNFMLGGTTNFFDRFSIAILRSGGIPAGTIIYITDVGWSITANNFVPGTSEGYISWQVPAGGVAQGTEIYFISSFIDPTTTWNAYTTEAGTTTIGTTTSNLNGNAMETSSGGDQLLIYQTGSTAGPAGAYDNATRRFITAIHCNIEPNVTTYAAWDGNNPTGGNQSSVPPGLTNGVNAFLMSPGPLPAIATDGVVEPDNGKYNCTSSTGTACTAAAMAAIIYNTANWTYSNVAFAIGTTSSHCTYSFLAAVTINSQPAPVTACADLSASFTSNTSNATSLSWQEDDNVGFSSPATLADAGVYSSTSTNTLTISNITGLNGRFYRLAATNTCGTVNSNGALLTVNNPALPSAHTTVTQNVNTQNNIYYGAGCGIITKVVPSGASQVTGSVTSEVWVEGAVPTYLSQPFVQRHYQVTPAVSPATATATITLYFSQAEFNAFNAAPGSALDLPNGPSDNAGKANLRVGKYNGSSNNGSGLPGSYTNGSIVIDPPDANIVWNATFSRWEVTFDVAGFSGFIVQTSQFILPVNLISFSAQPAGDDIKLKWQTDEEINHDYFELERSINGKDYSVVTRVNGVNGTGLRTYEWTDASVAASRSLRIFYRLKIVSLSGKVEYSNTVIVQLDKQGGIITSIQPNPFRDKLDISLNMPASGKLILTLSDISGKVIRKEYIQVPKGFSTHVMKEMERLSPGLYLISADFEGQIVTYKIIK